MATQLKLSEDSPFLLSLRPPNQHAWACDEKTLEELNDLSSKHLGAFGNMHCRKKKRA